MRQRAFLRAHQLHCVIVGAMAAADDLACSSPSSGKVTGPCASPILGCPALDGAQGLENSWNVAADVSKVITGFLNDDDHIPGWSSSVPPRDPQPLPPTKVFVDPDDMRVIDKARRTHISFAVDSYTPEGSFPLT